MWPKFSAVGFGFLLGLTISAYFEQLYFTFRKVIRMDLYEMFETDKEWERNGVVREYGEYTRITIARNGGSNSHKYQRVFESLTKPYRRMIEHECLPQETNDLISLKLCARAIITNWEAKSGKDKDGKDKWVQGIYTKDKKIIPYTEENVVATLKELDLIYIDILATSRDVKNYLMKNREADAKN